jgi:2,4-dienoyl-CoA reductase-like NADH-dependent reductase (Old Yellow Enzyme family)
MSSDALFRPFKLKGLNLPNRVVMAPMTRSFSPGGIPTEDVARYYRRRAEGAVGFIISEGTGVDRLLPAPTTVRPACRDRRRSSASR